MQGRPVSGFMKGIAIDGKPLFQQGGAVTAASKASSASGDSSAPKSEGAGLDDSRLVTFMDENLLPAFLKNTPATSQSQTNFQVQDSALSPEQWCRAEDLKVMEVNVDDPQVVPARLSRRRSSTSSIQALFTKNKAVFVVTVEGLPLTKRNDVKFVERTYEDFVLFREILSRRFPGSCPPALPGTQKLGSNRERVIRKRARLLTMFLQTIAEHPYYRSDQIFELFMASPIPFSVSLDKFNGAKSEGTERWRQAMKSNPAIKDAPRLIEALKYELREAERKLTAVKASAKLETERGLLRANAGMEMVKALDAWLAMERGGSTPLTESTALITLPKATTHTEASVPDALAPLSLKYANFCNALIHDYGESQMDACVLDYVRFELSCITNWFESLDQAMTAYRKLCRAAEMVKQASESTRVMGEGVRREMEAAKSEWTKFERGLLGVELSRFKQARVKRAMQLKDSISQMHVEGAQTIISVWTSAPLNLGANYQGSSCPNAIEADAPSAVAVSAQAKETKDAVAVAEPMNEEKLQDLALKVATKAVEESHAKRMQEEETRRKKEQEEALNILHSPEMHKNCRTQAEMAEMFWTLVYCMLAMHAFFVIVFVFRGLWKEAMPTVVLAGLTFIAGFIVELLFK